MQGKTEVVEFILEKNELHANPGTLYVSRYDSVRFTSKVTEGVLFFPKPDFFEPYQGATERLINFDMSGQVELKINEKVPEGDETPYAYYCAIGNDFAEGDSSPRIIIKD